MAAKKRARGAQKTARPKKARRAKPKKAPRRIKRKKSVSRAKPKARSAAKRARKKTAKPARKKAPARRAKRPATQLPTARLFRGDVGTRATRGLGAEAAGQSGDIEGLPRNEIADSESVEELVEEGQAFEAGIVD